MAIVKDLLKSPSLYLFSQQILGAKRARRKCINEYARPTPGMRILDIGCGPGYVLEYLPKVCYYGFDVSPSYIASAKRKYGEKGQFYCQHFDAATAGKLEPFDLVLMMGLLHHLNDKEVLGLFEVSLQALGKGGTLITLDGCYHQNQSLLAKFLLKRDRGEWIREASDYSRLASKLFRQVDSHIRGDLFILPYSALIMVCRP
jgi:SAM-dependent methyltransferase